MIKKYTTVSFTNIHEPKRSDQPKMLGDDIVLAFNTVNEQFGDFAKIEDGFKLDIREPQGKGCKWYDIRFTIWFEHKDLLRLKLKDYYLYGILEDD